MEKAKTWKMGNRCIICPVCDILIKCDLFTIGKYPNYCANCGERLFSPYAGCKWYRGIKGCAHEIGCNTGHDYYEFEAKLIAESAKNRQPVKDVDGNAWLPMLLDEFESMADVIEHGQEWIPVKVRLPMPYENPVLVYDNSGVGMAWYSSKMGWVYRTGLGCVDITHWMPLPQPPKEASHD